jgi:hypothetical protein
MHVGSLDFRIQQVTPEIADALNMPKAEGAIVAGRRMAAAPVHAASRPATSSCATAA